MFSNRRNLIILGMIVLGMMGMAVIVYLNVRPDQPIEGVVQFPRPARGHDDTLVFEDLAVPPAGGEHFNIWQNCGIYAEPIESGNAVHSMEHGALWITYSPDLPSDQVATLEDAVRARRFCC